LSDTIAVSPSTGTIAPKSSEVASQVRPDHQAQWPLIRTVHVSSVIEVPKENRETGFIIQPAVNLIVSYSVTDLQKIRPTVNNLQLFNTDEGLASPLA